VEHIVFDHYHLKNLATHADVIKKFEGETGFGMNLVPFEDPTVYARLSLGDTAGLYDDTFNSEMRRFQPDCFEDIVAFFALWRPESIRFGAYDYFIDVKHRREVPPNLHSMAAAVLTQTYGVMVYEEQLTSLVATLADFSLEQCSELLQKLRRKEAVEMALLRRHFLIGAECNGISNADANKVFDFMDRATCYAYKRSKIVHLAEVVYVSMYLKNRFPVIFDDMQDNVISN
jgi:DNA polymerase-3 subunit alpha